LLTILACSDPIVRAKGIKVGSELDPVMLGRIVINSLTFLEFVLSDANPDRFKRLVIGDDLKFRGLKKSAN